MSWSTESFAVPLSALADRGETELELDDAELLQLMRDVTPDKALPPPGLAERTIAYCDGAG